MWTTFSSRYNDAFLQIEVSLPFARNWYIIVSIVLKLYCILSYLLHIYIAIWGKIDFVSVQIFPETTNHTIVQTVCILPYVRCSNESNHTEKLNSLPPEFLLYLHSMYIKNKIATIPLNLHPTIKQYTSAVFAFWNPMVKSSEHIIKTMPSYMLTLRQCLA